MATHGTLFPLPSSTSTSNNPTPTAQGAEAPRSVAEHLLRAQARLKRVAASYGSAREELLLAREDFNAARVLLGAEGGELRSQLYALGAQLTVRSTEALARQEAMSSHASAVEAWARTAPAGVLQPTPPPPPEGRCRLCTRVLVRFEEVRRGYHFNCPEEGSAVAAVAVEGGAL